MQNLEKKNPALTGLIKQSDNTQMKSNNDFDNNSNDILTLEDNYCTKNAQRSWLESTVQMAIKQEHRPIPMVSKSQPAGKFSSGETYPIDNLLWQKADPDIIGIRLDDFILVDYDGNKPKGAIPLAELFDILGDEPNPVQENEKGDSIHYLYRIPAGIDKTTLKHSNDDWVHGVDIKTMNQLMHLKRHKTIIDDELPTLDEVQDAPQAIIDALTKVTSENLKARSESKAGKLKAAEIISHIDPDCEYNEWRNVGMGLHDEFKGDPLGLQIWDNWSANGSGYSGFTHIEYKYKSFTGDKGITFGTVCKMAKDNGADLSAIAKKYDKNGDLIPTYEELLEKAAQLTQDYDDAELKSLVQGCLSLSVLERHKVFKTIKSNTGLPLTVLKEAFKGELPDSDELDQLELAKKVVQAVGCEYVIATPAHVWGWDTCGVWVRLEERTVRQFVHNVIPPMVVQVGKHLVEGVSDLFKTEIFQPNHEFDLGAPESVNCLNGELELIQEKGSWVLGQHNRYHYRTMQIPVKYDGDATAPLFTQFLFEVFDGDADAADKINAVLEMMGYTLMAHCRHEKFIVATGVGANGKSVLLAIVEALCGRENVAGVQPAQFDNKFQRAHLHGKLANIVTEIEQGEVIADAALKGIVSGEPTTVENKFKDPFTMRPFATCWFGTNHMPHTRDFSDGLFRRTVIITFNNVFKPELGNCDPLLKDKLMLELPGILNMVLHAYAEALVKGFTKPESNEKAKAEWRGETDQVAQFIQDCAEADEYGQVPIAELFDHYVHWADDNGIKKKMSKRGVRERLDKLGYGNKRVSTDRFVTGLRLNTVTPDGCFEASRGS
jgi:putative DNA primase/helicase